MGTAGGSRELHEPTRVSSVRERGSYPEPVASPYPSVDALVRAAACDAPRRLVVDLARAAIDERRERGEPAGIDDLAGELRERVARAQASSLRPVLNATGVIVHTNLGRAPLAQPALEAIAASRRRATRTSSSTWRPGAAAAARRTSRRCFASSRAPRTRSPSTTAPPPCCWRWPRWRPAATCSSRAAS